MNSLQVSLLAVSLVFHVASCSSSSSKIFEDDDGSYLQFLNLDDEPISLDPVSAEPGSQEPFSAEPTTSASSTVSWQSFPDDEYGEYAVNDVPVFPHFPPYTAQSIDGFFMDGVVQHDKPEGTSVEGTPVESRKRPLEAKEVPPSKRQRVENSQCLQDLRADDPKKIINIQSPPKYISPVTAYSAPSIPLAMPQAHQDKIVSTTFQTHQDDQQLATVGNSNSASTNATSAAATVNNGPMRSIQFVRKVKQDNNIHSIAKDSFGFRKIIKDYYKNLGITGLNSEDLHCKLIMDVMSELGYRCEAKEQALRAVLNYLYTGELTVPSLSDSMRMQTLLAHFSNAVKEHGGMKCRKSSLTVSTFYVLFKMIEQYSP